ncbi:hypothetical protein FJW10_00410 [Mesorhizobium sp. B4-1-1]|nr:hypothetical protein FJW10_00410 [Mesorhizobium sp. B4-1-1]
MLQYVEAIGAGPAMSLSGAAAAAWLGRRRRRRD